MDNLETCLRHDAARVWGDALQEGVVAAFVLDRPIEAIPQFLDRCVFSGGGGDAVRAFKNPHSQAFAARLSDGAFLRKSRHPPRPRFSLRSTPATGTAIQRVAGHAHERRQQSFCQSLMTRRFWPARVSKEERL